MNCLMLNFQRLGGRLAVAALFSMLLVGAYLYYLQSDWGNLVKGKLLPLLPLSDRENPVKGKPTPVFASPNVHVGEASPADDHPDMRFLRMYGRVKGLPGEEEIRKLSAKELNYIYHSYLDNTDYQCTRKLRMGKVGDGGWEVCDDYQYRPIKPCIVYSFGINYEFSFDDDIGKLYGCDVFSFDPSMKNEDYRRSDRVHFYKLGLSDTAGRRSGNNWLMETLTGIKAKLKHQNATIDVLKMDIEHAEWPSMKNIMAKGELSHVRQLMLEYHLGNTKAQSMLDKLLVLKKIEDLGFRRFHTHLNPACHQLRNVYPVLRTACSEIYYVNTRFARNASAE